MEHNLTDSDVATIARCYFSLSHFNLVLNVHKNQKSITQSEDLELTTQNEECEQTNSIEECEQTNQIEDMTLTTETHELEPTVQTRKRNSTTQIQKKRRKRSCWVKEDRELNMYSYKSVLLVISLFRC